jgi:hypothetical protein
MGLEYSDNHGQCTLAITHGIEYLSQLWDPFGDEKILTFTGLRVQGPS